MSAFAVSQLLIGIAFLFDLASFQLKRREFILVCFTAAAGLNAAHFFLLGATTAGFVISVSTARFFISIFTTNDYVKYACLAGVIGLGFYTFDGIEDLFSMGAGLLGTLAAFQKNDKTLRVLMMGTTSSIIVHNILIWTPAGIALELFFLGSNLVGFYRFYIRKSARAVQS